MDKEQEENQFLGCFGILKESCNIVSSWRKIFTQITISLIIPLSFIYLAHIQIQELLFTKIMHNEYILDTTPEGTTSYNKISNMLSSELTTYFLFKFGYFVFFIILALLSTSAVVYTVACIYTGKEVTLKKVMSVVPNVWKRLMVTFMWSFIIIISYNVVSLLVLFLGVILLGPIMIVGFVFIFLFSVIYLIGILYITIIWHLASVVSVLEERYGLNAMAKSRELIKGKMGISFAVFLLLGICFFGVQIMFELFVVIADGEGVGRRILYGIIGLAVMSILMLFGIVAQTVIYFVCKSYHHENIDKSSLADHLGGYLGDYLPLKTKDVLLRNFEV